MADHEAFLRRTLEEQQQAAELQQAIKLEGRRFMGLQLCDVRSRGGHHFGSPIGSPMSLRQDDGNGSINGNGNGVRTDDITIKDKDLNSNSSLAMSAPASSAAAISATDAEGKREDSDVTPEQAVNAAEEKERSRVLVISGTGYIGQFIVAASAREGYPTAALVRDPAPAEPTKAAVL